MQESVRRRRTGTRVLGGGAVVAAAALVAGGLVTPAIADVQKTDKDSAAHAHILNADGLGLDILDAGSTKSEWTAAGANTPVTDGLNVTALGAITIKPGSLDLPLVKDPTDPNSSGLLDLGDAGALQSVSLSDKQNHALSAAGVVNSDGSLNLDTDGDEATGENAKIDLTALFDQLNLDGLTDQVLDEAAIELGAIGARAEKTGETVATSYNLADLKLNLHSPALEGVTGLVDDLTGGLNGLLSGITSDEGVVGVVNDLLGDLNVNIAVAAISTEDTELTLDASSLLDSVSTELLNTPLNNATTADGPSSVNIDLSTGTVSLDLAELLVGPNGPYAEYDSINDLPANTDLLHGDAAKAITSGIVGALTGEGPNSLTTKLTNLVKNGVYDIKVGLNLHIKATALVEVLTVLDTTVSLLREDGTAATLGDIIGVDGYAGAELEIKDDGVLGPILTQVLGTVTPILNGVVGSLGGVLDPLVDGVIDNLSGTLNGVLDPVVDGLLGNEALLKPVLDNLVTLTANVQPEDGDLEKDSTTVRALSLEVLPLLDNLSVKLDLASATVLAADEEDPENSADARAAASASASAAADGNNEAAAKGAALAAAYADATSQASAAAKANAEAAAQTAAKADVDDDASANASANSTTDDNAAANAAAEGGTATSDADSKASASADAAADGGAGSSAKAAASSNAYAAASANASTAANGDSSAGSNGDPKGDDKGDPNASAKTNASAASNVNASASASADSKANAAAKAAAMADNSTNASSKANANAEAAAKAAAETKASTNASTKSGGSAQAAAQAAAHAKGDSDTAASGTAKGENDASYAAKAAAISNASSNASGPAPNPNTVKCLTPRPAGQEVFLDVKFGYKFYDQIDWMHCMGLSKGIKVEGGIDYGPQRRLSREAMAAFMFRMMNSPAQQKAYKPTTEPFADMKPGDDFYKEIIWMHEQGYSTGKKNPNGGKPNYAPMDRLSREAMAAFIYRLEGPGNYQAPKTSIMKDMKPGDPFYTEINWMVDEGLSTGIAVDGHREYWPKERLSREAMAAFFERWVNDYRA